MKITRLFLALVLVLAVMVSSTVCGAETIGDFVISATDGGFYILRNYYGDQENLIIPSSFRMYERDWTEGRIAEEAFIYNTDLRTLVVPEGITRIG